MSLDFTIPELHIGNAGTPPIQFFRRGFNLGGSGSQPSWKDVILHGNTALTLVNAKANGLNYLKLFGGCEQSGTPTPDNLIDIVCNNGTIKARHQSGLPLGYKLVDYIKSDTLIKLDKPTNETMEFVAKFYREGSNAQYVYQSDTSSSGTTNTTSYISSGGNWRFGCRTASISMDTRIMITSVQNASGVWLNGEQVATYENMVAFTSTNNLRVFGPQATPALRLYWLKVYQNGAPFYDLIPCQRESDSVYGMYDLVNGKFFTNTEATITMGSFVSDPVVVKGAGAIEMVVDTGYFGNLIDLNALTSGYYYNSSGVYTSASNVYLTDWIRVYNGDTITVYFKKTPDANAPVVRMNIFDAQKNWVSQSTMTLSNQDEDVTVLNITEDGYIRISGASNLLDWDTVQIIRGNYTVETMPAYKAYVPYHTATAEMLLSVGDVKDVQSVLDGVITKNVGILILDGTGSWQVATGTGYKQFYSTNTQGVIANSVSLMSNIAPYGCTASTRANYDYGCYSGGNGNLCFQMVGSSTINTTTDWTNYLSEQYQNNTPVIVIYPKLTATTESVTPQSLTIQAGTNIVEITQASMDNLELEVSYKAGVEVTVTEIENAQLDNSVEVTVNG